MTLYRLGWTVVFILFKFLYRFKVEGHENLDQIPENQGVLLCSNHISGLDPPLVGAATSRKLAFMAKAELFEIPFFGGLIKRLNAFPVKRGTSDRNALKLAIEILNSGETLIMFPEGTRSKTGELKAGLGGVGFLALRTNAAIVPVAIKGGYRLFRRTHVVFGKPIDFTELKSQKSKPREATELVMAYIQKLLDEKPLS